MTRNAKIWLATLLTVLVFLISGFFGGRLSDVLFEDLDPGFAQFLGYVLIFAITMAFAYAIKIPLKFYIPSLKPEPGKLNPRLIVAGVILIVAASIVLNPIIYAMPESGLETLTDYMQGGLWPMLTSVVAAPVLEEFLFRGIIQRNLMRILGRTAGIIAGAAIFGLIHFIPQQVIYATGVGIIIGTIYYLTGSLNTVIAIHFVNNGLTYLLFIIFDTTAYLESDLFESKTAFAIAYSVSSVLLVAAGWYAWRQISADEKRKPKTGQK